MSTKVYRYRVKSLNGLLNKQSRAVNFVWNFCNDTQKHALKWRKQFNRPYLRYRGKRTLGWVPLKGRELKREGSAFRFAGNTFRVFNSRALPDGKIKDGTCFARDAQGNWFLNVVIEVADAPARPIRNGVGIAGLGIREWVCSDCGAMHDRDVNAALNILRRGRATLAVGILDL